MSALLVILIGTVLVNTFLLMQDDAMASDTQNANDNVAKAMRIAGATALLLIPAATCTALILQVLPPVLKDIHFFILALSVIAFAFLIDALVRARQRSAPALAASLVAISNSLALGTVLLPTLAMHPARTLGYAGALSIGFLVTLALFVALTARIETSQVPQPFRHAPITLISAGLLTLALMGLSGIF